MGRNPSRNAAWRIHLFVMMEAGLVLAATCKMRQRLPKAVNENVLPSWPGLFIRDGPLLQRDFPLSVLPFSFPLSLLLF